MAQIASHTMLNKLTAENLKEQVHDKLV
uniref:Uncharacterized protein n=1 Tax=Arundo donax TaxID=35708 RepID=A0A0A8Z962_ARUDO